LTETRYHARRAAAALLKMAKTTSDVEIAADLKDQAGELPPRLSLGRLDVKTEP
jgi:hypothetical protein